MADADRGRTEAPYDLAVIVDPVGDGIDGAGDIDGGEATTGVEVTMGDPEADCVGSYDLAAIVDPPGVGTEEGAGEINRGEAAANVEETMGPMGEIIVRPYDLSDIVDPAGHGQDGAVNVDCG